MKAKPTLPEINMINNKGIGGVVTQDQLAMAFTEWDRRYREEPERFMSEAQHLLKTTPQTYGEACAPYLLQIISEQNDKFEKKGGR